MENKNIAKNDQPAEWLMQKAFSTETIGVLFFSLDGRIQDANNAFLRMSGYSHEELVSLEDWGQLTPQEFMKAAETAARELAENGETKPYEKQMIHKDGSHWWGLFAPTRVSGEGRNSQCVEFIIDITERKLSEEALRQSEARFRRRPHEIDLVKETAERTWAAVERAKAEESLRTSEAKFRSVFETMIEACCIFEMIYDDLGKPADWKILEANAGYEKQSGLKDVAGKLASEVMPGTEPYWIETFGRVVETGEAEQIEKWHQPTERWIHSSTARVGGSGSRRLASVFYDITERKRRELEQEFLLKLSDALRPLSDPLEIQRAAMRVIGEHLRADRVLYAEITPDGETAIINDNYARGDFPKLTGSLPTSAFGAVSANLRSGQIVAVADVNAETDLSAAEKAAFTELNIYATAGIPLNKGGRWVAVLGVHHGQPRRWRDEEIALLQETAERTWAAVERARAEEALQRAHAESERRVLERTRELREANVQLQAEIVVRRRAEAARAEALQRLVTAQEDERRRISRDLHDTVGQYLAAFRFGLHTAKELDGCPAEVSAGLAKLAAVALKLDEEIDRLSYELRPPSLDDLGLEDAVRSHVQEWSAASGIAVDLHIRGLDGRHLPATLETTVYRIVQEALTNILKHARASSVSMIIERRRDKVHVIIEDDGCGFDPAAIKHTPGIRRKQGLLGMHERTALAGGQLDIEAAPGAGTTIYLHVPIISDDGPGGGKEAPNVDD